MKPNAVLVSDDTTIKASYRSFGFRDEEPVFKYIKYNIDSEGQANIRIMRLKTSTYETIDSLDMQCQLGKGFRVFGESKASARA